MSGTFDWRTGTQIVTGAAGFLGANLCRALLSRGARVVCIDNLVAGSLRNLAELQADPHFEFRRGDAAEILARGGKYGSERASVVWAMAALASPVAYFAKPLDTIWAGADAQRVALEFAADAGARFMAFSSSEVYSTAPANKIPTPETYVGNVNSMGLRAPYDIGKLYIEALSMVFARSCGLDVRIVRPFNVYGPFSKLDDGRMVPAFLRSAMRGEPLVVHGDGAQTRSLVYVEDFIDVLLRVAAVPAAKIDREFPVYNLGNPDERSVMDVATACWRAVHGPSAAPKIKSAPRPPGDPDRRCPDVSRAVALTDWRPRTTLEDGVAKTLTWFQTQKG